MLFILFVYWIENPYRGNLDSLNVKIKSTFKTLTLLKLSRTKNVTTVHGHIQPWRFKGISVLWGHPFGILRIILVNKQKFYFLVKISYSIHVRIPFRHFKKCPIFIRSEAVHKILSENGKELGSFQWWCWHREKYRKNCSVCPHFSQVIRSGLVPV